MYSLPLVSKATLGSPKPWKPASMSRHFVENEAPALVEL